MATAELVGLLRDCAAQVNEATRNLTDWHALGDRPGQYRVDLVADEVAVRLLTSAGFDVLSEESGHHGDDRELLAVVDPIDGSTNASRGLAWYATSICLLDARGPLVAVVVNQATGTTFEATRDEGARRDGVAIAPSRCTSLDAALIGLSGLPLGHLGWAQYRALGAIALDLCAVAEGVLDGYLDCGVDAHGPWDYLAGMFIAREAGAMVSDLYGRELVADRYQDRRTPVAGATATLCGEIVRASNEAIERTR